MGNRVGDGTPGPGRPKGLPNKTTATVKEMVAKALDKAGGAAYLLRQAEEQPVAFMSLVAKLIPTEAAIALTHSDVSAEPLTSDAWQQSVAKEIDGHTVQ